MVATRRRRGGHKTETTRQDHAVAVPVVALLVSVFITPSASAQDEPVDTDGDGQRDDWNGDGIPDNEDDLPCAFDGKDDEANTGVPDGIPDAEGRPPGADEPPCVGEDGSLPEQLSLQQISVILTEVFFQMLDVTEEGEEPDGWPNIRRLLDEYALLVALIQLNSDRMAALRGRHSAF